MPTISGASSWIPPPWLQLLLRVIDIDVIAITVVAIERTSDQTSELIGRLNVLKCLAKNYTDVETFDSEEVLAIELETKGGSLT